jgi:anti-sigma factor RsiW
MKEGFDKEIDSLLRRHGRAGAGGRGDGARAAEGAAHLDADELSAFAEGALPAAARLAAVSHLADCDECRAHVVLLSRAAGVEGEIEKRAAPAGAEPARPARRRGWLSALFAPRVLRYAAPALALCLVAAVSFVALRTRRGRGELAGRVSSGEARRAAPARVEEGGAGDAGLLTSNANMSANANVSVAQSGATSEETQGETAAKSSAGAPRAAQPARGPNAGGETEAVTAEEPKRAEAPPPAAEEKAPAAAAPAAPAKNEPTEAAKAEDREAKAESKEKDQRKSAAQEVAANEQLAQQEKQRSNQLRNLDVQTPDGSRNQRAAGNNMSNNSAGVGAGLAAATPREDRDKAERGGAPASRRARSSGESRAKEGDDEAGRSEETRSAAGHRFRREGGAWVDVKYKPSMPSTGVRRGTDSYRALVADIPEVGRVAEQLGGEVVVVIKGRAYRIR